MIHLITAITTGRHLRPRLAMFGMCMLVVASTATPTLRIRAGFVPL